MDLEPVTSENIIPLTQGKSMTVDTKDRAFLEQYSWYALKRPATWYAMTNIWKEDGRKVPVAAHTLLMQTPPGLTVDHKNRNGLDNRRANLRVCTRGENLRNKPPVVATSCFKGVSWHTESKKWLARIKVAGQIFHLGMYDSDLHAARAYDIAAREHHLEFAYLNGVDESIVPVRATKGAAPKKSTEKGVYWDSHGQRWSVKVRCSNKMRSLGTFKEEKDAVACARRWFAENLEPPI